MTIKGQPGEQLGHTWDEIESDPTGGYASVSRLWPQAEPWVRSGELWKSEGPYMANLTASMRRHGQLQPIQLRDNRIMEGNHRLAVAERLGWDSLRYVESES